MKMDLDLARSTLEDLLALDRPIGALMEIAGRLQEGADKEAIKQSCGMLLLGQLELIEKIQAAYPQLDKENETLRAELE
jgi:hypothetical protein